MMLLADIIYLMTLIVKQMKLFQAIETLVLLYTSKYLLGLHNQNKYHIFFFINKNELLFVSLAKPLGELFAEIQGRFKS